MRMPPKYKADPQQCQELHARHLSHETSVVDPHTFYADPDPGFFPVRIRILYPDPASKNLKYTVFTKKPFFSHKLNK